MKRYIKSNSDIDKFVEDQAFQVFENYRYDYEYGDYSLDDLVEMVWEHVVMIIEDMDEDGLYEEYLPVLDDLEFRQYVENLAESKLKGWL